MRTTQTTQVHVNATLLKCMPRPLQHSVMWWPASDLWPSKPFQQWTRTWWIFAPSFIKSPSLSTEIVSRKIRVNGRRPDDLRK